MNINKSTSANTTVLSITGRIDTVTASDFLAELMPEIDSGKSVRVDLSGVNYISSAGLRVFLAAQKEAKKRDCNFVLIGVIDEVMDVFKITGFDKILKFE
jgi:anti-sigma B factor antagonist